MFGYTKHYFGYDVEVGLDINSNAFCGFLLDDESKSVVSKVSFIDNPKNCDIDWHMAEVLQYLRQAALEYAAINGTPYELLQLEQKELDEFKARGDFRIFTAKKATKSKGSGKEPA